MRAEDEAMNKIVREQFPVADLPEVLRTGFDQRGYVRVTIEPTAPMDSADAIASNRARLAQLFSKERAGFAGLDQITEHIEALRREWD